MPKIELTATENRISKKKHLLLLLLVALLVSIFTFPDFSPLIVKGLDGSQNYGLNYLNFHHIQFGKNVVFTFGPLGFITAPDCMGHNLLEAIFLVWTARLLFIWCFLLLGYMVSPNHLILNILLVVAVSNHDSIDISLIGGVISTCLLNHISRKNLWLIIACLLTVFAQLIKASYGIMCGMILFSYALYMAAFVRKYYIPVYAVILCVLFFLSIWFKLYYNFSGISNYLRLSYEISKDNSNAMQIEAVNNWGELLIALILFYIPGIFTENRNIKLTYIIITAALYASFRYSFAREENWHETFIFNYALLILAFFILLNNRIKIFSVALIILAIALLHDNMVSSGTYNVTLSWKNNKVLNFISYVINYKSTVTRIKAEDDSLLQDEKLNDEQRHLIGNNTVDIFPSELAYVKANNLNWQPRPSLQSGYAYTPLLDRNNAAFFNSSDAPGYIVWTLEQPPGNNYSFDYRYLLNDDPSSIYALLNHYKIVSADNKTILLGHSNAPVLSPEQSLKTSIGNINEWLDVPETDSNSVLRACINFKNTFKGALLKMLYKDAIYFIDYRLNDGTIKTYRFIPANAGGGLWINPLVTDISHGIKGKKVHAVRIWTSKAATVENEFTIEWKQFHVNLTTDEQGI